MPATPYQQGRVSDIPGVIQRLAEIGEFIKVNGPGHPDGIWCFNNLYADITAKVLAGVNNRDYPDNGFMASLDVAFANRYLDALRQEDAQQGGAPAPWRLLIDRRREPLAQIQFAAAGVNAHIDFDLAAAVVEVWLEGGGGPHDGEQHNTYQQIDGVFAGEMSKLRHEFEHSKLGGFDRGKVDRFLNFISDWTVNLTRDLAWGNAARMWALRHLGADRAYMEVLAVSAAIIGEGLLAPLL